MEQSPNAEPVEQPRGIYQGRIDEKGRLKLPADFQRYLTSLGAEKVFITSFDARMGRIYPLAVWKEIEKLLRDPQDDVEAAEDLWFTANDLGGDAELDAQGRLLMPAELRRALDVENQPVFLEHYKGHINVFSSTVYQDRKQRAAERRSEKLSAFERRGLP